MPSPDGFPRDDPWDEEAKERRVHTVNIIKRDGSENVFSANKIAIAIRRANEAVRHYSADFFGGVGGVAFSEGLVKERGIEEMDRCPACGCELSVLDEETAECPRCRDLYDAPDYTRRCYVHEEGVAEFVGRRIGNGFAVRTGDHYHLGEVRGRTLYFATNPGAHFYSGHKGDNIALVVGSNDAKVPYSWNGHVAFFSELFYVNEPTGELRISRNILKNLLPGLKSTDSARGTRERKVLETRSRWLMFFSHLFSSKYNPGDFYLGHLRPAVARDWFVGNHHDAPTSTKKYQRDLRAFRHLDADSTKPDQREEFIVLLLRTAADPKLPQDQRLAIAKALPNLVMYLEKAAEKNNGRPVNITRGAWQYSKDGTRERVAVAEIDKFFDDLDKRMGQGEDAA